MRIGLVRIGLIEHHPRPGEAGESIHVSIGLVLIPVTGEPDNLLCPEGGADLALGMLTRKPRIAVVVEDHRLRGEHRPLAIHMECTAFEHQR